jgi:quercetin dioxygenase-like cupin family protein
MSIMSHQQDWPDELDALNAAPQYHALLFENEAVRVLETRIRPGQTVPLHTHRWPSVLYIVSWSDFVRRDGKKTIVVDSRITGKILQGSALWSGPLPSHTLENVGESELRTISVELKIALAPPLPTQSANSLK